jgi:predicted outer membrane repeat protein
MNTACARLLYVAAVLADSKVTRLTRRRRRPGWLRVAQVLLFAVLLLPHGAMGTTKAKVVTVGSGTATSCTETALQASLTIASSAGGGTINFNCGGAPVTIALTQPTTLGDGTEVLLIIPNNTTIDGGGLITLDGTRTAMIAMVAQGSTVGLRNITIVNGDGFTSEVSSPAGCIANGGTLTIEASTVSSCLSDLTGAISNDGALTIANSTISNSNGFFLGGGITNGGVLTIQNSIFTSNSSGFNGGAIFGDGSLAISKSTFSKNQSPDGEGGALYVASASIDQSIFSENGEGLAGGAIFAFGDVTVDHSMFSNNGANSGGAIFLAGGSLTVERSVFLANSSFIGGAIASGITNGGGIFPGGTLSINQSSFSGNVATYFGGAIFVAPGQSASVSHSTLLGNDAGFQGGGIYTPAALSVDHSVIAGNSVIGAPPGTSGGGIFVCEEGQLPPGPNPPLPQFTCNGTMTLAHTSVTGNTPDDIAP